MKEETSGNGITIDMNNMRETFIAGEGKRWLIDKAIDSDYGEIGFIIASGEIRFADKTVYHALLEIDESDSAALRNMAVFLPNERFAFEDDENFFDLLGKPKEVALPYFWKTSVDIYSFDGSKQEPNIEVKCLSAGSFINTSMSKRG